MNENQNIEMKKCKHCQSDIAKKAKVCPQCGKKQGGALKWIIIAIVAIAIIGAASGGEEEKPTKVASNSTETTVTMESVLQETMVQEEVAKPEPISTEQKNALRSASTYLAVSPFSHQGLVKQLEFEGYSNEAAVYAADNCGANWNEQAAKSAKNYLSLMAFSKDGLIEQLEFEGFTHEQAVYGAEQNGY